MVCYTISDVRSGTGVQLEHGQLIVFWVPVMRC